MVLLSRIIDLYIKLEDFVVRRFDRVSSGYLPSVVRSYYNMINLGFREDQFSVVPYRQNRRASSLRGRNRPERIELNELRIYGSNRHYFRSRGTYNNRARRFRSITGALPDV
mgnify:CR=1 FL=1